MRRTARLLGQIVAVVILAVSARTASAAVVAAWTTTGAAGNEATLAASAIGANISSAAPLSRGTGVSPNSASNNFAATGWEDLSANDYFAFGFTVAAGYQVDLSSLYIATRSSNTGPGHLALYYSGDGYASPIATFTDVGIAYTNSVTDLSALPNLTGAVTFHVVAADNVSANGGTVQGTGTLRIGDYSDGSNFSPLRFEGTITAVPEPSTMLLGGAGLVGLVALSRAYRKRGTK